MKRILIIFAAAATLLSCSRTLELSLVPYPDEVIQSRGYFDVVGKPIAYDSNLDETSQNVIKKFAAQLSVVTGTEFEFVQSGEVSGIVFLQDDELADEAYSLEVTKDYLKVTASGMRGFNYAIQTLKQLLPVEVYGKESACEVSWKLPCVKINDKPRFAYRGMHLDEARHFFGVEEVKRYLDVMEIHKLNTFHWHLTDDQGWRIEIKKYPELTSVGSVRNGTCIRRNYNTNDHIPYGEGMWYTQEQIREIVQYAAEKGIDIIPEIDLPGHMLAALAAYPHLGCSGGPYAVWHRWGVSTDVLCAGNEKIYTFLQDVLSEVCELFPCEYVHIGGDECPKDSWKSCPKCQAKIKSLGLKDDEHHTAEHYLQSYIMSRMENYLASKGKKVIGWDEILEGDIAKTATVMSWRGEAGGIKAAGLGHDVIMTPNTYCYWDYYQATDIENEPFAIGGYVPVELVYSYEPYTDAMSEEACAKILGVQANVWTEYIADADHLEYMMLPRLGALSEVQWCAVDRKDWDRFLDSAVKLCSIYEIMGYSYAPHMFNVSGEVEAMDGTAVVTLKTQGDAQIRYTLDGTEPTIDSPLYKTPISINETCMLKASALRNGELTRPYRKEFTFHKAVGRTITLTHKSVSGYSAPTGEGLLDGIRGPAIHKSKEWCSWLAKPLEAVIDMSGSEPYSSVTLGIFLNKPSQIFNPSSLSVSVSEDGENYTMLSSESFQAEGEADPDGLKAISVSFPQTSARYLKVTAQCFPTVPDWHHYPGKKASIFVDEIIVQ